MNLDDIQQMYESYTLMYNRGEISATEYKDLLEGIEISKVIADDAIELEQKEQLNTIIRTAIGVASAVA